MRAAVSVVIPTWNAADSLPVCLGALMEGLEAGLIRDLVISDAGSDDATLAIAEEVGAVVVESAPSRGGQIGRGAAAAKGDWLLILHADTVLAPGWAEAVRTHIAQAPGKAGWFRLRFDAQGAGPALVAGWANLRARVLGLPFGDQGLLIARALLDAVGGVPDIPLMEDLALARALGRRRLAPLLSIARTSARRYATEGWIRRGAQNMALQLCFLAGAAPERLARRYRRSGRRF